MVIISIIYDWPESPMLYTKFRENRSTGSGEEDFLRVLLYMGMAAKQTFVPPTQGSFDWLSGF